MIKALPLALYLNVIIEHIKGPKEISWIDCEIYLPVSLFWLTSLKELDQES